MYYGLSNFYQNHRRYVKSRDDSQLNGDRTSLRVRSWMFFVFTKGDDGKIPQKQAHFLSFFLFQFLQNSSKECEPYRTSEGLPIAPCGAIANSLFNGEWNLVTEGCDFALWPVRLFPRTAAGSQECCCLNSRLSLLCLMQKLHMRLERREKGDAQCSESEIGEPWLQTHRPRARLAGFWWNIVSP